MRIQKAIQEGHLKFDNKMKLDGAQKTSLMDLIVRLLCAWYASCRMNSWLQLIKLCRRRCRQTLMRLSNLG
jgi:hypothetical protein